jgi:hypothetical protein
MKPLSEPLSENEIATALKHLPNGKAAGMDGIPSEMWKILQQRYEQNKSSNNPRANICKLLTRVFNDIETNGVEQDTAFALGWICPIYKKGDRSDIANYRPITVLNADYKILTKSLNNRLSKLAAKQISEEQVGFIPRRSIFNPIKLNKMLLAYAESEGKNGLIVALDQEKAYDKVIHDYLWEVLKIFGLPSHFIKTVASLYQNVKSVVIINGVISMAFDIHRGVRQGDPLSCLLFDYVATFHCAQKTTSSK